MFRTFPFSAITSKVSVNICIQLLVWAYALILLSKYPRVEWLGHVEGICLTFKEVITYFLTLLRSYRECTRIQLVWSALLVWAILSGCVVSYHCGFNLDLPNENRCWHIFMSCSAIHIFYLCWLNDCSILLLFFIGLFSFLLLRYKDVSIKSCKSLGRYMFGKYLRPCLPFHLHNTESWRANIFNFDEVLFIDVLLP